MLGISTACLLASCSVQHFAVNTDVQPFQYGGKIFGEKTKGKEFRKSGDLHILGINAKKNNTKKLLEELNANSYTIETKSNLIIYFITFGIADYKTVKIIKRDH